MIEAVVNEPFTAILSDYVPGVAAQLTVEVYDPVANITILPASGTGITEPRPGTYTVTLTAPTAGTFLVRWAHPTAIDPENLVVAEEELRVTPVPQIRTATGAIPTLEEIGAINRARTDDGKGDTLGIFTANTRPTANDVEVLRQLAADQVADRLGTTIPDAFQDRARGAAAYIAAALVEGSTRDPRDALIKMWTDWADARLKVLEAEIAQVAEGGEDGPGDENAGPLFSFPGAPPTPEYL